MSSVGSSTFEVIGDASSLSSLPEMSSQALDGAAGNTPGKLDAKKRVLGSNGKRIRYTSVNERGEKVPVTFNSRGGVYVKLPGGLHYRGRWK